MKTEPDPDATVQLVKYVSSERVADLVRATHGGPEFFIQILFNDRTLMGLTNYGRIFEHQPDAFAWIEIPCPEIEP